MSIAARATISWRNNQLFISRACQPRTVSSAGFTLIELVSVLVLIGTMSAVVAPRIDASLTQFHQRFIYDETVSALRYARNRAMTKQCSYAVRFGSTVNLARRLSATDGLVVVTARAPDGASPNANCVTFDLGTLRSVVARPNSRESELNGQRVINPFYNANENSVALPNTIVAFGPLGRPFTGSAIDNADIQLCIGVRPIIIRQHSGLIETPVRPACAPPS